MLDYLFFDTKIAHRFFEQAKTLTAEVHKQATPEGGISIQVDETSLDEQAREQLEDWYDTLFFGDQAALVAHENEGSEACAVQIQLANGDYTSVVLAPKLMTTLLSVLDAEDIQALFTQVADAVENPKTLSVCHLMQCAMREQDH
jgi:hypothetical protein